MSEVGFTKGPWNLHVLDSKDDRRHCRNSDGSIQFEYNKRTIGQGGKIIAEANTMKSIDGSSLGYEHVDNDEEMIANAHLIAAAPDLYEALERLTDLARRMDFSDGVCCCGDSVEGHGFGSGHSPVDAGLYYSEGAIQQSLAALAKARGETA